MIVPGSTSQTLAARLADDLGEPLAPVEYDQFPDGEVYVRVGDQPDNRAIVVASTTSPTAHLEVLLLQDALREAGVSEIVTVIPYMGYARQDTVFEAGEPVSARAVARAISTTTDRVLTVTPHEKAVCDFFDPAATALDGAAVLDDTLPSDLADPVFVAPDEGAISLAETVRDQYGAGDVDYFEKERHSGDEVTLTPASISVSDRAVVVVDDIVATGSTMSGAIEVLTEHGADATYVATVHGLLVGNAITKLRQAGIDGLFSTDTIEGPTVAASVAPLIADSL